MISVEERLLMKLLHQGGFFSTLFDVKVDGKAERVLARDVQFDPVSDKPVHIDFLRVSATTSVHVEVPVHFINRSEEHTSELQSLMRISYAVFCLKNKQTTYITLVSDIQ